MGHVRYSINPIKQFISANLIWIITLLFSIGACYAVLQNNTKSIDQLAIEQRSISERTVMLEKCVIKINYISEDIIEIRSDLKDIKSVLLKPSFANIYDRTNKQTVAMAKWKVD